MMHRTLDTSVEYLRRVAHAQALDLGLLKEGKRSWGVEDWDERINAFGDWKCSAKSNYREGLFCRPRAIIGVRKMKKTWTRPELVVLVRGSDEERVLGGCKTDVSYGGPAEKDNPCASFIPLHGLCINCDALVPS